MVMLLHIGNMDVKSFSLFLIAKGPSLPLRRDDTDIGMSWCMDMLLLLQLVSHATPARLH